MPEGGTTPQDSLPPAVSKNPAVALILEQKIPGVLFPANVDYPRGDELSQHAQTLIDIGLGVYIDKQQNSVVFNPVVVSVEEVEKAGEAGELEQLFPEYGKLTGETPTNSSAAPMNSASVLPPSPSGAIPKQTASAANSTNNARLKNMTPGAPTSGPFPGAGRVVNTLAKRAV